MVIVMAHFDGQDPIDERTHSRVRIGRSKLE